MFKTQQAYVAFNQLRAFSAKNYFQAKGCFNKNLLHFLAIFNLKFSQLAFLVKNRSILAVAFKQLKYSNIFNLKTS